MKPTLPLVLLFLISLQQIHAQEFEPGYIITFDNDTVQGMIKEQVDNDLVHEIEFRSSSDSESKEFNPRDISGFGFDYGRTFRTFKFTDIVSEQEKVIFAKEVEKGKIDVLIWRKGKNRKPDMFLINRATHDTVHLTRPKKKMTTVDGRDFSQEDRDYLRLLGDVKGEEFEQKKIRYTEDKIRKDISLHNQEFSDAYETRSYKEKKEREYILLGGTAVSGPSFQEQSRIRAAVIQTRTAVERTNTFSYISGVFYTYREKKEVSIPTQYFYKGHLNYKRQVLSFIPIGLMFQSSPGTIRPYIYAGGGVGVGKLDDYFIEFEAIQGTDTEYVVAPTLVAGAGLKIRVGSNYLVTEISPGSSGVYLSAGFSF
ncbi:hypothetical protein [Salinimicrobium sp. HB62]|uniref:hypothetical protein n=1 Tax=Salinimicrobium sp. HB62 TaxID=3077781 RepID=UPI002D790531|nr:hypothetical protein [Salinimicrobium sp. HB62]